MLNNSVENWENTLDQLNNNYRKQCLKISKQIKNLKHMEDTIVIFELHTQQVKDDALKREKSM